LAFGAILFVMTKKEIRTHRKRFRDRLDKMNEEPALKPAQYKSRIYYHAYTLSKYMTQFNWYLVSFYVDTWWWNRLILRVVLGKDRLYNLLYGNKQVKINEVYRVFKYIRLKGDFIDYLIRKTHFSFNIFNEMPEPETKTKKKANNDIELTKNKFAEFVYLILAEYIILHNYMWASKYKLKTTKHLDKWMKDFRFV